MDCEIREYIDQRIEESLYDIRKEIDILKSGKVSKENAVTKNDIGNLLNRVKAYR